MIERDPIVLATEVASLIVSRTVASFSASAPDGM